MESAPDYPNITLGEGYAVGSLDDLGDGPGFRKVRKGLGVTAFGVNAIVMPPASRPAFTTTRSRRSSTSFTVAKLEIEFGDGSVHRLNEGSFARVDPPTLRRLRNVGEVDAIYLIAGGKDGYVGRDGRSPEGEQRVSGPPGAVGATGP